MIKRSQMKLGDNSRKCIAIKAALEMPYRLSHKFKYCLPNVLKMARVISQQFVRIWVAKVGGGVGSNRKKK